MLSFKSYCICGEDCDDIVALVNMDLCFAVFFNLKLKENEQDGFYFLSDTFILT
jgi:hypothetical protein